MQAEAFFMRLTFLTIGILSVLTFPGLGFAQTVERTGDAYMRGQVIEIVKEGEAQADNGTQPFQVVKVRISTGEYKGQEVTVNHGLVIGIYDNQRVSLGDRVVLVRNTNTTESDFYIVDKYRLPSIIWLSLIFLAVVVALGKWRGAASILGLMVSVLILTFFVIPQVVAGSNPLIVSLVGAVAIILISLYLAHGFNLRTSVSVGSTMITLVLTIIFSAIAVKLANLSGVGSEDAFYLQIGNLPNLDLRGLLLGGMIIGTLGVLDDITTSQAAAVEELSEADTRLTVAELYKRGISIGNEHIASLVNTLALAYVGASFPLLLLFHTTISQPAWVIINGEQIAEEIVRTLVGSMSLVLAVPIVTLMAAYIFANRKGRGSYRGKLDHSHFHRH